jgi:hypothetical protein
VRKVAAAQRFLKTDSSNNEQVHGGDIWGVIAQESEPSLAGRSSPFDHVLGNARLSDLKPKLEKLAMDARRSVPVGNLGSGLF